MTGPDRPATGLWADTAPDLSAFPTLGGPLDVDVVVIGGGYTGVSAAYHLAASGASVALLEARTIGFGGSGRNVGLVNAGLWTPPDTVETRIGKEAGTRLNAVLANAPDAVFDLIQTHQIRCEAVRRGTLHCAHSQAGLKDLRQRHAQQRARNAPVRLLDAAETARRTGSAAFHGALWDGRAGTIQPLAYVRGLTQVAAAQGALVFEQTPARQVRQDGTGWRIETPGGTVRAARLIQATNAYGTAGAPPNNLIPAHFFQLATEPLPRAMRNQILPGGEGCWDTATVMSSFRLDQAGRMIFGALGNLDGPGRQVHVNWARRKLTQLFPGLKRVPFAQSWTGRIAMTRTYLPRIESRGINGISIYGYSGRGIAPGTVFGRAAAHWALGSEDWPVAVTEPQPGSANRLRSAYYELGATLAHVVGGRGAT